MMTSRTKLMRHQAEAVNKLLPSRVGALFMEMGTGKSRTAIELVLQRQKKIDRIVWFTPVSVKETIRREILKHTDCKDADIVVFDNKINDKNIDKKAKWYIVGIESMSASVRVALAVAKIITTRSMIILDESSYIKGYNSKRTQRITLLSKKAKYRLILTGTPLSQGVVDLYAQLKFLSTKILGYDSFYSFAANHLEYSEKFPGMIVRAHNTEYLAAKIKPYVYQVTKAECMDLPKKIYKTRYFNMTDEQRYAYEYTKDKFLSEIDYDDFDSTVIFRLFTALQQIVCGFKRVRHKRSWVLEEYRHERINCLFEIIKEIKETEKIIIWTKYHYDIEHIAKRLTDEFGEGCIALFHGRIPEKKRIEQLTNFQSGPARFFLATQSCGGHGITLNEANHVIFYNNGFKYSERLQAEDRCHRKGQNKNVIYWDIECNKSIDERIADTLASKGSVVDEFRREVEKVKKEGLKELIKSL